MAVVDRAAMDARMGQQQKPQQLENQQVQEQQKLENELKNRQEQVQHKHQKQQQQQQDQQQGKQKEGEETQSQRALSHTTVKTAAQLKEMELIEQRLGEIDAESMSLEIEASKQSMNPYNLAGEGANVDLLNKMPPLDLQSKL